MKNINAIRGIADGRMWYYPMKEKETDYGQQAVSNQDMDDNNQLKRQKGS